MTESSIRDVVEAALEGRRLLDHPFYRRWQAGELEPEELTGYAGQYRHFEAYLPRFLGDLVDRLPEGPARKLVEANLADELGQPLAHIELFDSFARAVGAPSTTEPSPATRALTGLYAATLSASTVQALGALTAYEIQAAEIAASKAEGLRRRYGLDPAAVRFWEVHAELDAAHGDWVLGALASVTKGAESEGLLASVRAGADAWWAFLDEREAARPSART